MTAPTPARWPGRIRSAEAPMSVAKARAGANFSMMAVAKATRMLKEVVRGPGTTKGFIRRWMSRKTGAATMIRAGGVVRAWA